MKAQFVFVVKLCCSVLC